MIPLRDTIQTERTPYVTRTLIAVNVLVFLYQLSVQQELVQLAAIQLAEALNARGLAGTVTRAAIEARAGELYLGWLREWGAVPAELLASPDLGEIRSIFSSMFLHGDWLHLGGNMLFLWVFADNVEDRLGRGGFVLFYLTTGVAAALAQTLFAPESTVPMVGASGAISGALGAFLVLFPHARVVTLVPIVFFVHFVELPAWIFLVLWFAFHNLLPATALGAAGGDGGVAYWAHIGGFVAGAAMCWALRDRLLRRPVVRREMRGPPRWRRPRR
jgi:membrane associated rhomboid family serine protease